MNDFGKRLKYLREEIGLSQNGLANMVGVAQNTIAQYENGATNPSVLVLLLLTKALSTTTDYLLGLTDEF